MLKQLYIDNFRAFVNFTLPLEPKQLLLGRNGTGKSSVLDVLRRLRQFVVESEPLADIFGADTLTRWQTRAVQTFEIDVLRDSATYRYRLEVEHADDERRSRVLLESLEIDRQPLFSFRKGEVQLYRDDGSAGPGYTFDWHRSALATIQPRNDNTMLSWFKERLERIYAVRIDAPNIQPSSDAEAGFPNESMSDFVAWYRHASGDGKSLAALLGDLHEALPGLENLALENLGRSAKLLRVEFAAPGDRGKPTAYDFNELSDGQRSLIVLYALLHFALRSDSTVLIDEPDNYVSLDEIQPWLLKMMDRADETGGQIVFVSHHPELLDLLAREHGVSLARDGCGPIRCEPFRGAMGSDLPPSEQIARGWDRD